MARTKRLSKQEWDVLLPNLERLKARSKDMAHEAMIDGATQETIAKKYGVSISTISKIVTHIWQMHIELGDRPPGWVNVNLALPPELAVVVQDMADKARERVGK